MLRTRWAAVGAAVAVTLGASGIGLVTATQPDDATTLVQIEPCRIADTRPGSLVGPKSSPLGPGETYTLDVHGTNGDCTIPAAATGLSLNVTAVGATENTFLTFWGDGERPTAANLNPRIGGAPTPNAVVTPLTSTGALNVFNRFGTVHVVLDVNGYYTDHDHDDRYFTKAQTGVQIELAQASAASGTSLFQDPTFVPDHVADNATVTVTTTRTAHLLVMATIGAGVSCSPLTTFFAYVLIDGAPVESTAQVSGVSSAELHTYVGVTDTPIPAGDHEIELGLECRSGSVVGGSVEAGNWSATVVELP